MRIFNRNKPRTVKVNGKKVEVVAVTEPHVFEWWKPEPKRWVVVRRKDSRAWCGPWKADGKRWSVRESEWAVFTSRELAEGMAEGEFPPFNFAWDVFEL